LTGLTGETGYIYKERKKEIPIQSSYKIKQSKTILYLDTFYPNGYRRWIHSIQFFPDYFKKIITQLPYLLK